MKYQAFLSTSVENKKNFILFFYASWIVHFLRPTFNCGLYSLLIAPSLFLLLINYKFLEGKPSIAGRLFLHHDCPESLPRVASSVQRKRSLSENWLAIRHPRAYHFSALVQPWGGANTVPLLAKLIANLLPLTAQHCTSEPCGKALWMGSHTHTHRSERERALLEKISSLTIFVLYLSSLSMRFLIGWRRDRLKTDDDVTDFSLIGFVL